MENEKERNKQMKATENIMKKREQSQMLIIRIELSGSYYRWNSLSHARKLSPNLESTRANNQHHGLGRFSGVTAHKLIGLRLRPNFRKRTLVSANA